MPREDYSPLLWGRLHEDFPDEFPALTAEEQQVIDEHEIRQRYSLLMAQVAQPYTQTERETWFTQLKEADEYIADNTVSTPMLSAMATARNITVATLAAKIKENDALFRQAIGTLLGQQQAELDALAV